MIFITGDKSVVMLLRKKGSRYYRICCIGRKQHYRKEGGCKHIDAVMEHVRPEVKSRIRLNGFGRSEPSQTRLGK